MSLLSQKEILNLKLSCIKAPQLRTLATELDIFNKGNGAEIIKRILERQPNEKIINEFIKRKYAETIQERRSIISDTDLKKELMNVKTFSWGAVQGQLDQKIQAEYVRRFVKYDELLNNVKAKLHGDVTNYVICTWYNHWTTVLIEEHIGLHSKVVPTVKNVKGVDIFFGSQPFDLKVTYLPRGYEPMNAIKNPTDLAIWMYENQGEQRFGADNRLFVILLDRGNLERSWEIKRDFDLIFKKIDTFFEKETVSKEDEIVFTFRKKTYTTVAKVLIIVK